MSGSLDDIHSSLSREDANAQGLMAVNQSQYYTLYTLHTYGRGNSDTQYGNIMTIAVARLGRDVRLSMRVMTSFLDSYAFDLDLLLFFSSLCR